MDMEIKYGILSIDMIDKEIMWLKNEINTFPNGNVYSINDKIVLLNKIKSKLIKQPLNPQLEKAFIKGDTYRIAINNAIECIEKKTDFSKKDMMAENLNQFLQNYKLE